MSPAGEFQDHSHSKLPVLMSLSDGPSSRFPTQPAESQNVGMGRYPQDKVPAELANRARVHPRTAERWLSLRTGMSDDALAALLQSDDRLSFLDALMAQANPVPMWWQDFRAAIEREQINRQLSELRQQLKAQDQRAKVKPRG